jgi:hypothetical protein|tara:strand:- start:8534 stop:9037 length:504 start_codon:yes stop_codon:yes gene_type:complete
MPTLDIALDTWYSLNMVDERHSEEAAKMAPRDRKAKNQGSHWIRDARRLAIYNRDGFACCWCGVGLEDDAKLTLDHCKPYSYGGTTVSENLITACHKCNSSRGNRSLASFARSVAAYINHGLTARDILGHVRRCRARVLDVKWAREVISRRSSFSAALAYAAKEEMT